VSIPPFVELPATAERTSVQGAGCALAALVATPPDGTPELDSVLFVPGYTGAKEDFVALLDPLARLGLRVVAIDQRGQYESPTDAVAPFDLGSPTHYGMGPLAADVTRIAADLTAATRRRPHIVGHSFGGLVARAAVLDASTSEPPFASLTLLDSGPGAVPGVSADRARLLLAAIEGGMSMPAIWRAHQEMDPAPPSVSAAVLDDLRRRWYETKPASLLAMGRSLLSEPDRTGELANITTARLPTLVACGVDDDCWPVSVQRAMAKDLGARYATIDGAGHSPAAERPEATAELLAEFFTTTRC
jgi:pimeloyl-ACP methyl ester carboxylesterase